MRYLQVLSCSNDLGSCCTDKVLSSIFLVSNSVISLIKIVVPLILLVMVSIDLMKLMMNPDEKKGIQKIINKFIAAAIVFFLPTIMGAVIGLVSETDNKAFSFAACIKESKNVNVETKAEYTPVDDEENVTPIIPDAGGYESGKGKDASYVGNKFSSRVCTVGDSKVKLVYNDSHAEAKISRKANGNEVANYAKSWIGKMSYEFTASGPLKVGGKCSCSHFVYQVLKHFNMIEGNFIRSTVWGSCNVKGTTMYSDYSKLVPGDVVFMTLGGTAGHVGFYVGNGKVVDCNTGAGVTTSNARSYTSFIHLNAYD